MSTGQHVGEDVAFSVVRLEMASLLPDPKVHVRHPLLHRQLSGQISMEMLTAEQIRGYKDMSRDFGTLHSVFGSDEAVRAYEHHTQAALNPPVPPAILYSLSVDLLLAARRDMAHPETTIAPKELLGIPPRIIDMYTSRTPSSDSACKRPRRAETKARAFR